MPAFARCKGLTTFTRDHPRETRLISRLPSHRAEPSTLQPLDRSIRRGLTKARLLLTFLNSVGATERERDREPLCGERLIDRIASVQVQVASLSSAFPINRECLLIAGVTSDYPVPAANPRIFSVAQGRCVMRPIKALLAAVRPCSRGLPLDGRTRFNG